MNEKGQTRGNSEHAGGHGGETRWQEMPRDLLVETLEDAGGKLIQTAAQQLPAVLALGRRVVEDTTARIEKTSTEEILRLAQKQLKERPAATIVGLLGAGMLAGRLLRLKAIEGEGTGKLTEKVSGAAREVTGAVGKEVKGVTEKAAPTVAEAGKTLRETAAPLIGGGKKKEEQPEARAQEKEVPEERAEARPEAERREEPERRQAAPEGEKKAEAREAPPSAEQQEAPKAAEAKGEEAPKQEAQPEKKPEEKPRELAAEKPAPTEGKQEKEEEKKEAGYLGIGTHPVRLPEKIAKSEGTNAGLMVLSVEPGSPAEKAGFQLGDTLLKLEDEPLPDVQRLIAKLSKDRIGKELHATVLRAGSTQSLTFTVGAR